MPKKIKYKELPDFIKNDLSEDDYLVGFLVDDQNNANIIVWTADRDLGRPIELEYNQPSKRKLSLDERKEHTPSSFIITTKDPNAEIRISHSFEDTTNILKEHYQIIDLDHMKEAGKQSEPYFSAFKRDPYEIAKSILRKNNFPKQYALWNRDQRINYWIERLYKMRRQAGESGSSEDIAFDKNLANEMLSIDPDIKSLLPECIMNLSQLEQVDHAELLSTFRKRTGLLI